MNNTLKTLSTIIIEAHQQYSLEQLADAYKKDLNPSILASAFSKCFDLTNYVSAQYFGLNSEDIASFSLEVLDLCLQNFTPDNCAFTTYYTTVLKNRFRTETQALSTQKRKVAIYSDSLDVLMEDGFDVSDTVDTYLESRDALMENLKSCNLRELEKDYCNLLAVGYNNSEISKILKVSVMTLSNLRKSLRTKLAPLCL
jgi:DNA-directed RNA polymerase specialized sigma24 family protein